MSFYYIGELFKEVVNLQKQQLQEQRVLFGILCDCVFLLYQGTESCGTLICDIRCFLVSSHL